MAKILVTGAAGFIGSHLTYRLWKEGNEVILIDNYSFGTEDNLVFHDYDFNREVYKKDIRNVSFLENLFQENNFDMVYHIAAVTPLPDCQDNPVEAVDINVRGTVIMLDLVRRYGVRKMFFASTSAVYENSRVFPSNESDIVNPDLIYPGSKYFAEQLCRMYSKTYGIPVICFRFANVYGPHIDCLRKQPPVIGYIIREYYKRKSPVLHSSGEQKRDFIFVDDLIDLCLAARVADSFDIVNVSTGIAVSIQEIARIIAKQMNVSDIPVRYEDFSCFWGDYPGIFQDPYPIFQQVVEHEVTKYTCLSNHHALKKYGWTPKTTLEEGLDRTVRFVCEKLKKAESGNNYG